MEDKKPDEPDWILLFLHRGGMALSVIFVAAGLIAAFALAGLKDSAELWFFGLRVEGMVFSSDVMKHNCEFPGQGICDDQLVDYVYEVDGRRYRAGGEAPAPERTRLRSGDVLTVWYLPQKPRISELSPGGAVQAKSAVFGFAMVLVQFFAWLILMGRRRAMGLVQLRDHGEHRQAVITSLTSAFRQGHWKITWRDDFGQTGESLTRRGRASFPEPGAKIQVYVDRLGKFPPAWEVDFTLR